MAPAPTEKPQKPVPEAHGATAAAVAASSSSNVEAEAAAENVACAQEPASAPFVAKVHEPAPASLAAEAREPAPACVVASDDTGFDALPDASNEDFDLYPRVLKTFHTFLLSKGFVETTARQYIRAVATLLTEEGKTLGSIGTPAYMRTFKSRTLINYAMRAPAARRFSEFWESIGAEIHRGTGQWEEVASDQEVKFYFVKRPDDKAGDAMEANGVPAAAAAASSSNVEAEAAAESVAGVEVSASAPIVPKVHEPAPASVAVEARDPAPVCVAAEDDPGFAALPNASKEDFKLYPRVLKTFHTYLQGRGVLEGTAKTYVRAISILLTEEGKTLDSIGTPAYMRTFKIRNPINTGQRSPAARRFSEFWKSIGAEIHRGTGQWEEVASDQDVKFYFVKSPDDEAGDTPAPVMEAHGATAAATAAPSANVEAEAAAENVAGAEAPASALFVATVHEPAPASVAAEVCEPAPAYVAAEDDPGFAALPAASKEELQLYPKVLKTFHTFLLGKGFAEKTAKNYERSVGKLLTEEGKALGSIGTPAYMRTFRSRCLVNTKVKESAARNFAEFWESIGAEIHRGTGQWEEVAPDEEAKLHFVKESSLDGARSDDEAEDPGTPPPILRHAAAGAAPAPAPAPAPALASAVVPESPTAAGETDSGRLRSSQISVVEATDDESSCIRVVGRSAEKSLAGRINGVYRQLGETKLVYERVGYNKITFLFLDADTGSWKIASKVGAKGDFARCRDSAVKPWLIQADWKVFEGKNYVEDPEVTVYRADPYEGEDAELGGGALSGSLASQDGKPPLANELRPASAESGGGASADRGGGVPVGGGSQASQEDKLPPGDLNNLSDALEQLLRVNPKVAGGNAEFRAKSEAVREAVVRCLDESQHAQGLAYLDMMAKNFVRSQPLSWKSFVLCLMRYIGYAGFDDHIAKRKWAADLQTRIAEAEADVAATGVPELAKGKGRKDKEAKEKKEKKGKEKKERQARTQEDAQAQPKEKEAERKAEEERKGQGPKQELAQEEPKGEEPKKEKDEDGKKKGQGPKQDDPQQGPAKKMKKEARTNAKEPTEEKNGKAKQETELKEEQEVKEEKMALVKEEREEEEINATKAQELAEQDAEGRENGRKVVTEGHADDEDDSEADSKSEDSEAASSSASSSSGKSSSSSGPAPLPVPPADVAPSVRKPPTVGRLAAKMPVRTGFRCPCHFARQCPDRDPSARTQAPQAGPPPEKRARR